MSGPHLRKSGVLALLIISLLASFTHVQAKPVPFISKNLDDSPASPYKIYLPLITGHSTGPSGNNNPQPIGQSSGWNLAFSDDFNESALDSAKWRTCFWWANTTCTIEANGELQLYNPGDVLVQNGTLHLRAQKQTMLGWNGKTYSYTSGMVMTGGRSGSKLPEFSFTYGYAEARIKIPVGQGLWPAFWLLPTSYAWPPEIDIMEMLGRIPTVITMTYHFSPSGSQGFNWSGPDFSAGWHVIGLDWEPNAIVWYVDGVERARYTNTALIPTTPMYLLLNLAVGGTWEGPPNANTLFPCYYDIDYVRVWQK